MQRCRSTYIYCCDVGVVLSVDGQRQQTSSEETLLGQASLPTGKHVHTQEALRATAKWDSSHVARKTETKHCAVRYSHIAEWCLDGRSRAFSHWWPLPSAERCEPWEDAATQALLLCNCFAKLTHEINPEHSETSLCWAYPVLYWIKYQFWLWKFT